MLSETARRLSSLFRRHEAGVTLIETVVSVALVGTVGLALLSGLATASKAAVIADEHATAESLARSQLESAKRAAYVYEASSYAPDPLPSEADYTGYSVVITAAPLNTPDDGIQKITVIVSRSGTEKYRLVSYKVDR